MIYNYKQISVLLLTKIYMNHQALNVLYFYSYIHWYESYCNFTFSVSMFQLDNRNIKQTETQEINYKK